MGKFCNWGFGETLVVCISSSESIRSITAFLSGAGLRVADACITYYYGMGAGGY
jgi:hypothetical protein